MERAEWESLIHGERQQALDDRLRRIRKIADASDPEHDEPNAIAFALLELDHVTRELTELADGLRSLDEMSDSEVLDYLFDWGDALRHLLGHARDPRFFAVYLDETA
jgi:hypothetical protein